MPWRPVWSKQATTNLVACPAISPVRLPFSPRGKQPHPLSHLPRPAISERNIEG
ncbi:hypothetical protein P154DRAFT_525689 [Amniculicola lignicola CBS 123094]|uniref:Uncharacterized protein n=1 Tax=Amniculicola lignicola CBS 123094 TaxID=1392246 RepID=A0A6A5W5P2_9PLEO|nr:hypothetical protein P154DRAFT_525689 [Amniculicola lignicola CBS 123094]